MIELGRRQRWHRVVRLVAILAVLAFLHPSPLRAQSDATYTPAQRAEIKAVPLDMALARRANRVTNDMMALVSADPTLRKAFFATMGGSMEDAVRMLDAQPKIVALVRGAKFASVREYEIANMAFVTSYFVAKAYAGENLDPNGLTSPAQVAFVRSHLAALDAMMSDMPLMVPHTSSPK